MKENVNELTFYQELADLMNGHPDQYETLGEVDFTLGVVMANEDGEDLRLRLRFEELGCRDVSPLPEGGESSCDCWLEGDTESWGEMFDDITANGRATGRCTINSLTLVGDHIDVKGDDPMGVDRFFRFNQTIQQFFDGAAQLAPTPA
ncbi:MAG: hypothetical protein QF638_06710 [Acidimicrobiales bacterium]|jgi:hypothetical protein|nr:hypothetical protein [Acidimicrobiales bacterium]|tara:strand:- start:857 stop:1300 length:444 start_codon:yes stop_codon:yes gene_type:complete